MERNTSVTFNQLTQNFIQKLKDAFQMIDDDGDGYISEGDLKKILQSIGRNPAEDELNAMLSRPNGKRGVNGISFPEYLSLMADLTGEFPEEEELIECFNIVSDENKTILVKDLVESLKEAGFENPEVEFAKILKNHSSNQQSSGKKVFKSNQFLDTIIDQ
ncbi:hypothetical protein KAFR_0B00260 [Kazachstania africana CBS 2517]|uniref:EF-hand domain-containing protein n=1 Tax=Kazachstania africana (strain ATCC 22294 / BCRC 22015 / CBS 2517 / CECT 1963 / NBRC 1671 / NRRL Y-8276) TaxID=1071382 RepID=H2APM6_KAZAF|nr:hypothetical protein KAFR_0B00260 [Kazachstania africana CBS 2517]CCF56326.1 hypothetical protein KAFR_0B00260 [Kazachstania africana CBS 2517]